MLHATSQIRRVVNLVSGPTRALLRQGRHGKVEFGQDSGLNAAMLQPEIYFLPSFRKLPWTKGNQVFLTIASANHRRLTHRRGKKLADKKEGP